MPVVPDRLDAPREPEHPGEPEQPCEPEQPEEPEEPKEPGERDEPEEAPPAEAGPGGARRIRSGPWGRLAEQWVPEPLREARVDPERRGARVLIAIATAAAIATAVGVWRDRPEARPVEAVALAPAVEARPTGPSPGSAAASSPASPAAPATSAATSSQIPAAPTEIVVSVTGLVVRPGIVTVPAGSRVADAIAAAGGSDPDADLTGVNLALKLEDGASVVVGGPGASAASNLPSAAPGQAASGQAAVPPGGPAEGGAWTAPGAPAGRVNLNTADAALLDTLPGVGPVMSQHILAWRTEHGPFTSVDQLQEISGIGPARFAQLADLVEV